MDSPLAALRRDALSDFAELPAADPRRHCTPHLLAGLLERAPETLDPQDVETLTQLCLKVDVTGDVREYYKRNWKPPKGAPTLAPRYWRGLLVVLLIGSWGEIPAGGDDGFGFRLKCLNAVFTAADRVAARTGAAAVEDILRYARDRLESEITCPTP